jgi:hypothetical protein
MGEPTDSLADNMREGLESELAGLQVRLDALGEQGDPARREYLVGRIGQVQAALGHRATAKSEKRPEGAGEKRPG